MSEWSHVEEERRKMTNRGALARAQQKVANRPAEYFGPHRFVGTWQVLGYFCPGAYTADTKSSICLLATKWNLYRDNKDSTSSCVTGASLDVQ